MPENFDRRRAELTPGELKRRKFRDVTYNSQLDGDFLIERFVKCDGRVHIVEIVTTPRGGDGEPYDAQQIGEPTPCVCSEDEIRQGSSVWSVFS